MRIVLVCVMLVALARGAQGFDGGRWNISTGNLSVSFIQGSPVGAHPRDGYNMEPPPSVESLIEMKNQGLVAYEDYVAWGAVEREPGMWDWRQHDAVCEAIKRAGLHYVVYNWVHFPPVWLREGGERTLMKCVEHGQETNYLSIFDPRTIDHYDHFYRNLSGHFGDKIDGVYACILGPYGEGNYPLYVPDWINIGHCHEGYWCDDPHALSAFRDAMRRKYGMIGSLNTAWGTEMQRFSQVMPPREIAAGAKPSPDTFKTAQDRRRWLDFITWYHQAIIDFAEKSIQVTLRYFPKEKVRTKPGGNAGGVNPIAWGTYCPGYAKMAAKYGITLQPADCHGAYFGDKWIGTAYQFYGVRLSTEPAGGLDKNAFVRRMFSDASCGASQLFTYEFSAHVPEIQRYVHLLTGKPGDTDIAVLCPTTLYRLGADVWPTVRAAGAMRDLTDYDVLDEMLVLDGALTDRYRALVIFQGDLIEQSVLDKIESWVKRGGTLITLTSAPIRNVEGDTWPLAEASKAGKGSIVRLSAATNNGNKLPGELAPALEPYLRADGVADGVWTTRRGTETLLYNGTDKAVQCAVGGKEVTVEPHSIWSSTE